MKRLLISIFLPLVLSQSIAMAQTIPQNSSEPETQPASPVAVTNGRIQPPIVPLEGTDQIQLRLVNCGWG